MNEENKVLVRYKTKEERKGIRITSKSGSWDCIKSCITDKLLGQKIDNLSYLDTIIRNYNKEYKDEFYDSKFLYIIQLCWDGCCYTDNLVITKEDIVLNSSIDELIIYTRDKRTSNKIKKSKAMSDLITKDLETSKKVLAQMRSLLLDDY